MSPAAAFHAQLASIMEVLANTAVAEICELVDSGYSVLQLEISRSRKENEVLRRKLRLMELRAVRASALRAAAAASGNTAALRAAAAASGNTARLPPAHHPGNEPRRTGAARSEAVLSRGSNQKTLRHRDTGPSSESGPDASQGTPPAAGESAQLTAAVIKVEDDDESWSRPEQDKEFCHVVDGQMADGTEAPPPPTKQEVADEGSGATHDSWVTGEVSSTSTSTSSQRTETCSYDRLIYESQLQRSPLGTQNPLSEDPGCSYVLNSSVSVDSGGFSFTVSEVAPSSAELTQQPAGFQNNQQRAPLPTDEPQLPSRKEVTERQSGLIRRDRWRHQQQEGVHGASGPSREDGGGKTFVCNFCGKTLACLKNLKTHMRVHTGEKPFVCALCGKCFSDSSNLKRHQSVHTGEKRYGCVHCGKRFAQSGSLKVHMTVHTDCKQFRCSYCGKTFISGSHLRRHITMHAGEKQFAPTSQ